MLCGTLAPVNLEKAIQMPEARDVFDLRRTGQSEEAYALAKSL